MALSLRPQSPHLLSSAGGCSEVTVESASQTVKCGSLGVMVTALLPRRQKKKKNPMTCRLRRNVSEPCGKAERGSGVQRKEERSQVGVQRGVTKSLLEAEASAT